MTRSGFNSYGLVNHDSYKSKSYTGWGQNLTVLTDLAWNEKRPSLLSFHISLKYYPLQSHFEPGKIFSFKKKPWLGSHPTLGANERYFEDTDRING